jgi:hypothetical protein
MTSVRSRRRERHSDRFRLVGFALALSATIALAGCGNVPSSTGTNAERAAHDVEAPDRRQGGGDWFVDQAQAAGIDFSYFNGMSGRFYFPEMLGGGVALINYDNDGDLDICFAQGSMLGDHPIAEATIAPRSLPLRARVYRNDTAAGGDGQPALRFVDVTEQSGIDTEGDYGMGLAAGDFDNDGCVDLYFTNFGPNRLYRNNCDGTFSDVSASSGTAGRDWSVSAAFVDFDRDGWLDLYVGHYVQYTLASDKPCTSLAGRRDYCTPEVYTPQADRLYHNDRNGKFTDVTASALRGGPFGPALGVSVADFNRDHWPDIYVANDGRENLLWINQHDGTFRNEGPLSGTALSGDGDAEGSMGVDAGDFDNDGDDDLIVTNLPNEGTDLYVNDGSALFEDRSSVSRIGPSSLGYTGFGTAWFDFDNDGWLDLFAANGSIEAQKNRLKETFPYDEHNRLFRNRQGSDFEDVSATAGKVFALARVSRGVAVGDIDNDGDADLVVNNVHGPAQLLINTVGNRRHWLGLSLTACGDRSHCPPARAAVGAEVQVVRNTLPPLRRRARADGSYASASDPRVLVGLGDSAEAPSVRVTWPGGAEELFANLAIDRWTVLTKGTGQAP